MAQVFTKVSVDVNPVDNSKLITWSLDQRFVPVSGAYTFYVEIAYSAGDWTRLNASSPVVNEDYYIDESDYRYGILDTIYYRVVLSDTGGEWESDPVSLNGNLSWREWKILRNVLRQEYFKLENLSEGVAGWLLRRKHWGTVCTICTDYDLNSIPVNSSCTTCYGTGIVGGYYCGYPYYVNLAPGYIENLDNTPPIGIAGASPRAGTAVAYPKIYTGDIWVNDDTNHRYFIARVQNIAEMKELPIKYNLVLFEIPKDRIENSIPIESEGSSS